MRLLELTQEEGRRWRDADEAVARAARAALIHRARRLCEQSGCDVEIVCDGELLEIVSLYAPAPCPRCGAYSEDTHNPLCLRDSPDHVLRGELLPEGKTLD